MKKNLGIIDRVIRVLITVTVVILYVSGIISGALGIVLLIVSGILVLTSLVGTCPIYLLLGIKSNKTK